MMVTVTLTVTVTVMVMIGLLIDINVLMDAGPGDPLRLLLDVVVGILQCRACQQLRPGKEECLKHSQAKVCVNLASVPR